MVLATFAVYKLISPAWNRHAHARDQRRVTSADEDGRRFVSVSPSPSKQLAVRDLLHEIERRLSPDERRILELKNQGHNWAAIGTEIGGSSEALRRKLSRALDRVAKQLGLDDPP